MSRFGRFEGFEVKKEMRDGGVIRPDDNTVVTPKHMDDDLLSELSKVGFDDEEVVSEEKNIDIQLDDMGNPIMPEDWTFITHGSSLDRWNPDLLGSDFVVGTGKVNGKELKGIPLCCVERTDAKFSYERYGRNTAKTYGGKQQAFEIRVLLYKNPRLSVGKSVREKLNPEEIKKILKYYMYQDGRHPAVPAGTKLTFLKNTDFDEITNTNGNNIFWYIPEQYLQQYLNDVQQMQNIAKVESVQEDVATQLVTNLDVERELRGVDIAELDVDTLKYYLAEKLPQVYGDRLSKSGINIKEFLESQELKLRYYEGVETYKEIIEELEAMLEFAESMRDVEEQNTDKSGEKKLAGDGFLSVIKGQVVADDAEYAENMNNLKSKPSKGTSIRVLPRKEEI